MNGNKVDDETVAEVLARWGRMRGRRDLGKFEIYTEIARHTGLQVKTVAGIIYRHRPTVNLAQAKIRAAAARLAERVIEKANVSEAIDVLTRSNIGVLAPSKSGGSGGTGGFFLSVQADSCGAVKVGLAAGEMPGLPPGPDEHTEDEYTDEEEPFERPNQEGDESSPRPTLEDVTTRAKAKLAQARARLGAAGRPHDPDSEDPGLQIPDEYAQDAEIV